jgi:hypothetical protein
MLPHCFNVLEGSDKFVLPLLGAAPGGTIIARHVDKHLHASLCCSENGTIDVIVIVTVKAEPGDRLLEQLEAADPIGKADQLLQSLEVLQRLVGLRVRITGDCRPHAIADHLRKPLRHVIGVRVDLQELVIVTVHGGNV